MQRPENYSTITRKTDATGAVHENRHPAPLHEKAGRRTLSVSIYENDIPEFVEKELERLYENVYCTLARFRIYDEADKASTYVARNGDDIVAVILFRHENGEIKVVNQQIAIDSANILKFAETVFSTYPCARMASFYAIDTDMTRLSFPFQKFKALEEHVLSLPDHPDAYYAALSKSYRRNLRSNERKLMAGFPSLRYDIFSKSEVNEDMVREIARLTGLRMAAKNKKAYMTDDAIVRVMRLVRNYGFVGIASVDGRICGGNIWYRVGRRCVMHIIAHDPAFDHFALGSQLMFVTFCDCIKRGVRECWLMGGGNAAKARYLAVPKYLDSVVIYRSRMAWLGSWRRVAAIAIRQLVHRTRQTVAGLAAGEGVPARLLVKAVALAQAVRHRGAGPAGPGK